MPRLPKNAMQEFDFVFLIAYRSTKQYYDKHFCF